ncbi:MAG: hypothetical protein AAF217_12675 [Pseudomonadota bacterium]
MSSLIDLAVSPAMMFILLAVLAIEALFLLIYWQMHRTGLPPLEVLSFLGAGVGFSLALGFLILGSPAYLVAGSLILAFVFHILDLALRWRTQHSR